MALRLFPEPSEHLKKKRLKKQADLQLIPWQKIAI
jgi:hypothetical protein